MKRFLYISRGLALVFALAFPSIVSAVAPRIIAIDPPPGLVTNLTFVQVTFDRPVTGVTPSDLLVHGVSAGESVEGSGSVWRFRLEEVALGTVPVEWDPGHNIREASAPQDRFDETAPGASWQYTYEDRTPPVIRLATPAAGATVRIFPEWDVTFSEPVSGVEARDLLVNGQPATSVEPKGLGRFVFRFPAPPTGVVQLAWAPDHGIVDLAAPPNAFAGGSYTFDFNPAFQLPTVRISEFLAANQLTNGLKDEFGHLEDWIELHNYGGAPVNLGGFSLSDSAENPGKWVLPEITVGPGQYLVIFASSLDRRVVGGTNRLHANFQLNSSGDYLGLFNNEAPRYALTEFRPEYPEQRNNYSYGFDPQGNLRYFATPTPGSANPASSIADIVRPPRFNVERGMFDAPFTLVLTSDTPGALIRYTIDGSEPTAANGLVFTNALEITNTLVVRAVAFRSGMLPSSVETHTYIFIEGVVRQPNNPVGFPVGPTVMGGYPSDYEMDPEVTTNATFAPLIRDALKALPVLAISIKMDDMFGAANGIYTHPLLRGPTWEKPCSLEYFFPKGGTNGFQIDCSIQMQGNAARDPQKQPKHPMRVNFKGAYGPSKLHYALFPDSSVTTFNSLVLRADFNFSWLHWADLQRQRGQRTRDAWMKDSMRAMGAVATHNRYVHLYINGVYWGLYDPAERPDSAFAVEYLGGRREDYDIMNEGLAKEGTIAAYNTMRSVASGVASNAQYEQLQRYLDVPQFIDYMLLHFYVGHEDWGFNKNWYALRDRTGTNGFRYLAWDGENILGDANRNDVTRSDVPSGLHTNLVKNFEYRLAFADHVQKHFFNNGALTPAAVSNRWMVRAGQVDLPIIAESARWGDYRRDVHQYQSGPYELFTRTNQWLKEQKRLLTTYFPVRTGTVLTQLRNAGLFPTVAAPVYRQHGGFVPAGYSLSITSSVPVYYTTNGVDPRVYGTGAISPDARLYAGAFPLNTTTLVKARALSGTNWSALAEATFQVASLLPSIQITEIHYNPPGGEAYEFLELRNTGSAVLDLGGYYFDGITFIFPPNSLVPPGGIIVLSSSASPGAFALRYPGVAVLGTFTGNLSNGGERITLFNAAGLAVTAVEYDDENGWDTAADGGGYSLEWIGADNADPSAPANWSRSSVTNGSPGQLNSVRPSSSVVLNEVMAENLGAVLHEGTTPDWVELRNGTANLVDLSGWSLSKSGDPRQYVLPAGTSIPAQGYLVIWCDAATNVTSGLHAGFALSKRGESLFLYDATGARMDAVTFGPQVANKTVGRLGAHPGEWALNEPTLNAANSAAALGRGSDLVINEWLANSVPGASDWIELYNTNSTQAVALQGIYLATSNALFQIQSLSFVAPGGYVVLTADERAGADHLGFKLPAAGGRIVLHDANGTEVNRVTYGSQLEGVSEGRLPDGSANIVRLTGSASPGTTNFLLNYSGALLNEFMARNRSAVLHPAGRFVDWVELYNPLATSFDLSGMGLSDDAAARKWSFPSGATIAPGGHVVIWLDSSRPSNTFGGVWNAPFSLDGTSGGLYLFNASGRVVDSVVYGSQIPDKAVGRVAGDWRLLASPTPGTENSAAANLGNPALLRINEWMAAPLSGDDWVELFNTGTLPVEMGGLLLTDNPSMAGLEMPAFALLSFIGGRDFAFWHADGNTRDRRDHLSFALDSDGETLRLYHTNRTIIDTVALGSQARGVSQGRLPDGAGMIVEFSDTSSRGAPNHLPITEVTIQEVLARGVAPFENAIELHNPGTAPVVVGGWYLSDDALEPRKFRIPPGTTIPAGGYAVFYENQLNGGTGSLIPFQLAGAIETVVVLSAAPGAGAPERRLTAGYGASAQNVPFGRLLTTFGLDRVALERPTFGVDQPANPAEFRNGTGASNSAPRVGPIVINELAYHPPNAVLGGELVADEFVELHNLTSSPMALWDVVRPTNVWRLSSGVDFDFAPGTEVPARGFLIVAGFNPVTDPLALQRFRAAHGMPSSVPVVGPFRGRLNNDGEQVELLRPDAPITSGPLAGYVPMIRVDSVEYGNRAPWPVEADGAGPSLQRRRPADYGNDPANWKAAGPTPGRANVPGAGYVDSDADGLPDNWELQYGFDPNSPADALTDADDDGRSNLDEFLDGTNPRDAASRLLPPTIVLQPEGGSGTVGATHLLQVAANGSGPFLYQWRRNGTPIEGATLNTLTLTNLGLTQSGVYSVMVLGPAGAAVSRDAILTVFQPALVQTQPRSQTVVLGGTIDLSISATSSMPLRYQWLRDGREIGGATNDSLVIPNAQIAHAGTYAVRVIDDAGTVLSDPALVVVLAPPVIVRHPDSLVVLEGGAAQLTVEASGTEPFSYRWRSNGLTIVPQGTATYSVSNARTNDTAVYSVVVTNNSGQILSQSAFIAVLAPSLNRALPGSVAQFRVATPPGAYALQWFYYDEPLRGETNAVLQIAPVRSGQGGDYRVQVSSNAGNPISPAARLEIIYVDSDGDGLPDDWEAAHGFNPGQANPPGFDSDEDGLRDRDEFLAGTNPRDPGSVLKLESTGGAATNQVVLRFNAMPGRSYTVQSSVNLQPGGWAPVLEVPAGGAARTVSITNAPGAGSRFYRVIIPAAP